MSLLLSILLTILPATTDPGACTDLSPMRQYDGAAPPEGCLCEEKLLRRQVTLSLAPPFELAAVCELRWVYRPRTGPIDLHLESVTFDAYTEGEKPQGFLFLRGHAELRGQLRYQPGPDSEYWFEVPEGTIAAPGSAANAELRSLELIPPLRGRLEPSPDLTRSECWVADAVVDVRDIWLLIGQTDEAGAYPSRFRIEAMGAYRPCPREG